MREATNGIGSLERLGEAWCALMHDSPMWPIHGSYECRTCGRHYPVPWSTVERASKMGNRTASLRPAER
jgi:hypothetical protein